METTEGLTLTLTRTAIKSAFLKGYGPEAISKCFNEPKVITASETHPGQFRIADGVLVIVGVPVGDDEFRGITLYSECFAKDAS